MPSNESKSDGGAPLPAADCSDAWNAAVDTLASMCMADKMGRGPTKWGFILTLRLYADEMEKLIHPNTKLCDESASSQ